MTIEDNAQLVQQTEQALLAYCRRQGLFRAGDRVIAACSGGADSMALLLFLLRCRRQLGVWVAATHVNHGIRGVAAEKDAAFVADFCAKRGVPFYLYSAVQAGVAVPPNPSEAWARELRYRWFAQLAQRENAVIATAHTMNDQAETLLFRLARGTGVHGMAGILPAREVYARPCLCLTRDQTEAYCAALGQSYVMDESNAAEHYARNRIRHKVLPQLQAVNPRAVQAIAHTAARMQALDAWAARQADALLAAAAVPQGYDVQCLCQAEDILLETALHRLLSGFGPVDATQVALLRNCVRQGHGAIQPAQGYTVRVERGVLFCRPVPAQQTPDPLPPQPALPGKYPLAGGYCLNLQLFDAQKYEKFIKNTAKFKKDLNCCADYDKIDKDFWVRTRQPGDRFRPAGSGGHKTLKKLFNEKKIPAAQRALLPLLATGPEVLWLWGMGFAEGLAPDTGTRTVLLVQTEYTPLAAQEEGKANGIHA